MAESLVEEAWVNKAMDEKVEVAAKETAPEKVDNLDESKLLKLLPPSK